MPVPPVCWINNMPKVVLTPFIKGKRAIQSFKFRGGNKERDLIGEIQSAPSCVICGIILLRKTTRRGIESLERWHKRKTCGFLKDKLGHIYKSECSIKFQTGEKNSNFKGKIRFCLDCKERVLSYSTPSKKIADPLRCRPCYKKYQLTHWSPKQLETRERNIKKYFLPGHPPTRGTWKKGHKTWNKIGGLCTEENCGRPFLARGYCDRHYQSIYRKTKGTV